MKATSPLVQARGSRVTADSAPMTRSWWISGATRWPAMLEDAGVALVGHDWPIDPDVGDGQDLAACAGPRRSGPRRGRGPAAVRTCVGQPGPGGDLEAVVTQDPDGRHVGAQRPLRLVDDHREQLAPIVRGGEPPGDLEDGVEADGKLGGRPRVARRRTGQRRSVRSGRVGQDRADRLAGTAGHRRSARGRGARRRPAPFGQEVDGVGACTHVAIVPSGRAARGPPSVPVETRTIVRIFVDRHEERGLHSGGVATQRGPGRPIPLRGPHTPWTTVPVPSAPTVASSPGTRSVPLADG